MDNGFNVRDFLNTSKMTEEEIDYCEFWVNANRLVRESGSHNFEELKIQVNNKLNFSYLEKTLVNYEDKNVVEFLKYGWPLNAINTKTSCDIPPNQKGARENPEELEKYVLAECKLSAIIGLFKANPFGHQRQKRSR